MSVSVPFVYVPCPHICPHVYVCLYTRLFWPLCIGLNVVVVEMQSVDIFEVLARRGRENADSEGDGDYGEGVVEEAAEGTYYQDSHVGSDNTIFNNDWNGESSVDEDDRSNVSGPNEEKVRSIDKSDTAGC